MVLAVEETCLHGSCTANHYKNYRLSLKCLCASGNPPCKKISGLNVNFYGALSLIDQFVVFEATLPNL